MREKVKNKEEVFTRGEGDHDGDLGLRVRIGGSISVGIRRPNSGGEYTRQERES